MPCEREHFIQKICSDINSNDRFGLKNTHEMPHLTAPKKRAQRGMYFQTTRNNHPFPTNHQIPPKHEINTDILNIPKEKTQTVNLLCLSLCLKMMEDSKSHTGSVKKAEQTRILESIKL